MLDMLKASLHLQSFEASADRPKLEDYVSEALKLFQSCSQRGKI